MNKNIRHNRNVNEDRRVQLQIKYFNGLLTENEAILDNYLQTKSVEIEQDFMEDTAPYERILSSSNKNHEPFNEELKKYEEKKYWQRRKYKTKLIKLDSNTKDRHLAEYDEDEADLKKEFLEKLENKYPATPYSEAEISFSKSKIEALEKEKIGKLNLLDQKMIRLNIKIQKRNEKNNLKLKELKEKAIELNMKIQAHNKNLIDFEKEEVQKLKEAINDPTLSLKEKSAINDQISYLNTKIEMTQNEEIQLSVKNLKMYFGGIKAVNDVSFSIKKNQIFGLIGPNGAGKTTVFNCVTQFYKATSGAILYRNKENNIVNLNKLKPFNIINEGIARSFQNVELIWELSVLDNLLVSAHSLLLTNYFDHMLHTRKAIKEEEILRTKAFKILNDLQIVDYAYRYPYGLPYGILKKIELARTLMTDPSMIILDEPAAGLNEIETKELAGIIKKINQDYQTTIFLVEHDMSLVMSICDTILAISFGKELAIGAPKEIQSNEKVRIAYLGEDD